MNRRPRPRPARQRGAALLTAMIIVTLIATLSVAMIWQQWRAVQVESAERSRVQAAWILSGALDFGKLILRESTRNNAATTLTDTWATPLAEARLSTFLAVDKSNADDGPEAFLSGYITDANAKYNLANLVQTDPVLLAAQLSTLQRLCEAAGIDSSVATLIATGLNAAAAPTPSNASPLLPQTVSQLTWLGLDVTTVQALRAYVMLVPSTAGLPAPKLNINTASAEVLAAVADIDTATAEQMVQIRQRTPFADLTKLATQFGVKTERLANLDVRSSYFVVNGRLRLLDRVLQERSLLVRNGSNGQFTVLQRERVASLDQAGG